jgi:hypothetical protein
MRQVKTIFRLNKYLIEESKIFEWLIRGTHCDPIFHPSRFQSISCEVRVNCLGTALQGRMMKDDCLKGGSNLSLLVMTTFSFHTMLTILLYLVYTQMHFKKIANITLLC